MRYLMSIASDRVRRLRTPAETRPSALPRKGVATFLAATTVALAASAQATPLASGYLSSDNATSMVCYVFNVGSIPVTVLSAKIVNYAGSNITALDSCFQVTLQPGQRCGVSGNATQAAGVVQIDGPKSRVRGTCQINNAGHDILGATEMR